MGGEVPTLKHELRNHTVETRAFVAKAWGARAELTEVVGSLRNLIVVELEDDTARWLTINGDVEESVGHGDSNCTAEEVGRGPKVVITREKRNFKARSRNVVNPE